MAEITIDGEPSSFSCAAGDTLLQGGLRAGLGMPYECSVGACGSCKFELLSGAVETLWNEAPGLSPRDIKKGRRLACQSKALGDCLIKTHLADSSKPFFVPSKRTVRLQQVANVTHDMRQFSFAGAGAAEFLPGQYALLSLPGVPGVRAYSLSNIANPDGTWEFIVRRVPGGRGTTCLFEQIVPGDEILLDGPYGLAHVRPEIPRDVVCLAGGSGLAPMLSIARGLSAATAWTGNVHFFYGARTAADCCSEPLLQALPAFGSRFFSHTIVSDPDGKLPWDGPVGYVHDLALRTLDKEPASYEYYMAGPPAMIQAVIDSLCVEHAVPPQQIHFDRFF